MAAPASLSGFGYLPDPIDRRDRTFSGRSMVLGNVRESVDYRSLVQILDQGNLGSCVANSTMGAIRLKHVLNGIKNPLLGDRLYTYWGARYFIGTLHKDSGSHIRDAFKFLNIAGYLPEVESDHGYNIERFQEAPTPKDQHRMYDQKNKGKGQVRYVRLDEGDRISAIKFALSNQVIPVLGTQTSGAFLRYSGGILTRPAPGDSLTGGHAFYLCGYDSESVYVANSWAEDFGEGGFMRLSWEYIDWEETRDIWGIEDAPYFSHLIGDA